MKKDKNDKQTIKKVLKLLIPYRNGIGLVLLCFLFSTGITFLQPFVIKKITDDGMVGLNFSVIVIFSLTLIILAVIEQLVEVFQSKLFVGIQNKLNFSLFNKAFNKVLHLKMSYFEDRNGAEIINNLSSDVGSVATVADRGIMFTVNYILKIVAGLAGLLIISWKLALVVLAVVPVKFFIVKYLADKNQKIMERYIEKYRDFSSWFGDNIDGIKEIKLWNMYKHRIAVFTDKQKSILSDNKKMTVLDA